MRRVAALIPLACLLLAACGGAETTTVTETRTETQTVTETVTETVAAEPGDEGGTLELTQECRNDADGYSLRYPADWHTNDGEVGEPCSFFHPEPFEVPANTDAIGMAILVDREPVVFDEIAGGDPATRVLTSEETEVDGRAAVRREAEATGDGLFDAGMRAYGYLVDLGGGETLVVTTYDLEGLDYERNREVLDAIAQTLRLD